MTQHAIATGTTISLPLSIKDLCLGECNICGESAARFRPYGGRERALCPRCHSLERNRMFRWAYDIFIQRDYSIGGKDVLACGPLNPEREYLFRDCKSVVTFDPRLDPQYDLQMDISAMSQVADASFDVVLALGVLQHVRDDHTAMAEVHRVLRPGGRFFVHALARPNVTTREQSPAPTDQPGSECFRTYGEEDLIKLLSGHFVVKTYQGVDPIRGFWEPIFCGIKMSTQTIASTSSDVVSPTTSPTQVSAAPAASLQVTPASATTRFDEALLSQLHAEYRERPIVPAPRQLTADASRQRAVEAAARLDRILSLRDQRILEIGCGDGSLAMELASSYGAEVVGIDEVTHKTWEGLSHERLELRTYDISNDTRSWDDSSFTRIISRGAFEHIRHPFAALKQSQRLLHPMGKMYIFALLHPSAMGSHLYREISFPWPHLLFSPDTIASWLGHPIGYAFWLNKLSYAHYQNYLRQLGFNLTYEKLTKRPIDEAFYQRFEHRLGLHPRFDLETDFFEIVAELDSKQPKAPLADPLYARMR